MNTLQRHIASQPLTDPWPERRINAETVLEARMEAFDAKTRARPRHGLWRWLRALLPLLLLAAICGARADTYVVDFWGTVVAHWAWPSDRNVVITVPGTTLPPKGWPLQPNSYVLTTPAPGTPAPSPVPYKPL